VIVNLNALLLVVLAVLGLVGLVGTHHPIEFAFSAVGVAVCGATGVGLFWRRNWGRWLALGVSLLVWVIGVAIFASTAVKMLSAYLNKGYVREDVVLLYGILLLIAAPFIWLAYRLFRHLVSATGRAEFETPDDERYAVAKSTGLQLVWIVICAFALRAETRSLMDPFGVDDSTSLSAFMYEKMREDNARWKADQERRQREIAAHQRAEQETPDAKEVAIAQRQPQPVQSEVRLREMAPARNVGMADAMDEHRRKIRELVDRRARDRTYSDAEFAADREKLNRELRQAMGTANAGSTSGQSRASETDGERPRTAILKCRDSSGGFSYTQSHCPVGTTLVESSTSE
jgi:hypothetical protein